MSTRIALVRHGHVEGIDPPRFRGRSELSLTEDGLRQAAATRDYVLAFARAQALYASPLGRCLRTGAIIGAPHGLVPQPLPEFNDIDYGAWQGLTHDEVLRRDPGAFAAWQATPDQARIPGGETLALVASRVARALSMLLGRHPDATIILVGHDSVNRLLLLQVLGLPLSRYQRICQDPCAVNVLEHEGRDWTVHSMNETAHLTPARNMEARSQVAGKAQGGEMPVQPSEETRPGSC